MSRSRRKSICRKMRNPFMKNQANRRVRRFTKELSNGKEYKKLFCSWMISDYGCFYASQREFQLWLNDGGPWDRVRSIVEFRVFMSK